MPYNMERPINLQFTIFVCKVDGILWCNYTHNQQRFVLKSLPNNLKQLSFHFIKEYNISSFSHVLLTLVTSTNFFIYYFKHGNFCKQSKSNNMPVTNASLKTTATTRTRTGTIVTRSGNFGSGVAVANENHPPDVSNIEKAEVKVEFDLGKSPLGPQHHSRRRSSCCTRIQLMLLVPNQQCHDERKYDICMPIMNHDS